MLAKILSSHVTINELCHSICKYAGVDVSYSDIMKIAADEVVTMKRSTVLRIANIQYLISKDIARPEYMYEFPGMEEQLEILEDMWSTLATLGLEYPSIPNRQGLLGALKEAQQKHWSGLESVDEYCTAMLKEVTKLVSGVAGKVLAMAFVERLFVSTGKILFLPDIEEFNYMRLWDIDEVKQCLYVTQ